MGKAIELTDEQQKLKDKIYDINKKLWKILKNEIEKPSYKEIQSMYREMATAAHELHMSLKESGYEPKHHKYMIENRGVPVEDIEFYNHIHPVDDLLKFIDDINANDEPEDSTIGEEFTLKVYTRRWGHYDHYKITRTENGWDFKGMMIPNSGKCNKQCKLWNDRMTVK